MVAVVEWVVEWEVDIVEVAEWAEEHMEVSTEVTVKTYPATAICILRIK
jgi:hypothetical protein